MSFKKSVYKITHWETWPYRVKYIPLIPAWLWYCLRARSWWFFTPSNPSLTFGGFEGERKSEMYSQLPPGSFPKSIYISPTFSFEEVERLVISNNYKYPFVVKPDIGTMGFMFRTIDHVDQLRQYHHKMPSDYIIQEWITYPLEVSVFYYRFPDQQKGTITGFIRKEFLEVKGDGRSTLWELMQQYDRVQFRLEEMKAKHEHKLNDIIPPGEIYILSKALNLSRGGKLVSLEHEKDERLLQVFDALSHFTKYFYYGRYDIKCSSVEDLKEGKNFSILEYNGCGAEPHHAYGNGNTLWQAQKIFLHHWRILFRISKFNHQHGIRYWGFKRGWKFLKAARKEYNMLRKIDVTTEL
ncbi:MAG TPA: hypothetical protein VLJ68_13400 [Chitinophagaceae bacterium]|nr:hypothetical protein [Chitinophagaceae bacterium]